MQRIGAAAGALLLVCGAAPALSQPANNSDKAAAARTSSKPKAAAKRAASPTDTGARGGGSDYWSIDYALPNRYGNSRSATERARTPEVTTEINSEFGRVPVQTTTGRGSIGLTSGRVRASELDDGRPVPGLTANTRDESSYVGLSLSVTNTNKSFPVPVPMPWNRWE